MNIQLNISHLAVLRSCVEGDKDWTYFGSTACVSFWLSEVQSMGLVTEDRKPTPLGQKLYKWLRLNKAPKGRAYMWPNADDLIERGKLYLKARLPQT